MYAYFGLAFELNMCYNIDKKYHHSYYASRETGFYYLQSRYYDPSIGRFINADSFTSTGQGYLGYNMYAYCGNNPVTRSDAGGFRFDELLTVWEAVKVGIRAILHTGNDIGVAMGIDTAGIAAPFLCMKEGKKGIYHASSNCWQKYLGYNATYDFWFDAGTSMEARTFEFEYNDTAYVVWAWKGDYVNLGAGAELGIYYGGGPHWQAYTDWTTPMSLSLSYNGNNIITHTQNTWWITGFNSNYLNVQARDLSATYVIYFPNPEMYEAFAGTWNNISGWSCNPGNYSATFGF